jgi:hypothetical protein
MHTSAYVWVRLGSLRTVLHLVVAGSRALQAWLGRTFMCCCLANTASIPLTVLTRLLTDVVVVRLALLCHWCV